MCICGIVCISVCGDGEALGLHSKALIYTIRSYVIYLRTPDVHIELEKIKSLFHSANFITRQLR